jgi:hypothetical protein
MKAIAIVHERLRLDKAVLDGVRRGTLGAEGGRGLSDQPGSSTQHYSRLTGEFMQKGVKLGVGDEWNRFQAC